jgi:hypothetical protein
MQKFNLDDELFNFINFIKTLDNSINDNSIKSTEYSKSKLKKEIHNYLKQEKDDPEISEILDKFKTYEDKYFILDELNKVINESKNLNDFDPEITEISNINLINQSISQIKPNLVSVRGLKNNLKKKQ